MARRRANKAVTVLALFGLLGGMTTLVVYSVPLYRLFCQVTGYGGTTRTADGATGEVLDRVITIRFNADIDPGLPWRFQPAARKMDVRVGEPQLAFYDATSKADAPVAGTATFNVTPAKAGQYFVKIDCFCFTEQTLAAGESVKMPVQFYVDPAIARDRNLDDVSTITLSYTFFKALEQGGDAAPPARTTENRQAPRGAVVN
jgi:cytochrome c oxidase assembly protein subunit 11